MQAPHVSAVSEGCRERGRKGGWVPWQEGQRVSKLGHPGLMPGSAICWPGALG